MAVTNAVLGRWIKNQLETADGYETGELQLMRKRALDSYYGRDTDVPVEGRSDAQSNDVADMVEAIVSQLLPGLQGDSIVEFEPDGEDDVEQAQLESDIVNAVVVEHNYGYTMFQESLRDALLLRNGWTKAYLDEDIQVDSQRFEDQPLEALAGLAMQMEQMPGVVAKITSAEPNGDNVNATIKITKTTKQTKVVSVDPTNMRWTKNYDSMFIDDIPFLAERWYPTRSELLRQGYNKRKVNNARAFQDGGEYDQRGRSRGEQQSGYEANEKSMDRLDCYWVYYQYDSDGDGIAELHRILYVESQLPDECILDNEIVTFIPYATGTPYLQPHQLNGLGVWDKLHHVEDIKTETTRQWIDNLDNVNNSRLAINVRTVDGDDAINSRPGGIIRVDGPPGQDVVPVGTIDVGGSALNMLNYQDKVRNERAGASLELNSAPGQLSRASEASVDRQLGTKEQMAAMMCRTLAETLIRQTYVLTHKGMREWMDGEVGSRVRGEFASSIPAEWPERKRVNVKSGLSIGERNARRGSMEAILMQIEKLSAAGYDGVLVNSEGYHAAVMDWARAAMVDNADRYFMNPASEESQGAANQKAEAAEKDKSIQLQIATQAATAEQQSAALSNAIKKYEADLKDAFNYWKATLDSEVEMIKAGAGSTQQAEILQIKGEQASNDATKRASADSN